jgi:hypothetical protein
MTSTVTPLRAGVNPHQVVGEAALAQVFPKLELDTVATCETLSCTRSHLVKMEKLGLIKPTRRGRKVTYAMAELLRYVEAGRSGS